MDCEQSIWMTLAAIPETDVKLTPGSIPNKEPTITLEIDYSDAITGGASFPEIDFSCPGRVLSLPRSSCARGALPQPGLIDIYQICVVLPNEYNFTAQERLYGVDARC